MTFDVDRLRREEFPWAAAGESKGSDEQRQKGVQGKRIEWDARNLVAKNAPEVAHIIKPEFHNGYKLEG